VVAGDGCSATCTVQAGYACTGSPSVCATVCGDGLRLGTEQCDDGNTANGDCCSSACQLEAANCEREPNNNKAQADANGPSTSGFLYKGAVTPIGDKDYYAFTLTGVSDLLLETFDTTGAYNCTTINTKIELIAPDGTTQLALDDDSGPASCSLIDPNTNHTSSANFTGSITPVPAAQHLAPGTYYAIVRHFSGTNGTAVIPGYTFRGTILSTCGNGIIESTENCDDGNTASGDGCSSICHIEGQSETEPNNTCATANGPFTLGATGSSKLVSGGITVANEQDWFSFTTTTITDLKLETFDSNGPGSCSPSTVNTEIQVFKSDCVTTQSAVQDQGGILNCSKLDPATSMSMQHLLPGTYVVKVFPFSSTAIFNYTLNATVVASCGDGIKESSEQCDGGAACQADCMLIPVCGDGTLSAGEACDDGNLVNGDGCSSTCTVETAYVCAGASSVCAPSCGDSTTLAPETCDDGNLNNADGCDASCATETPFTEVEPNGTTAQADTNATGGLLISGPSTMISGAITPTGDKDIFKMSLASSGVVRFETFDPSGDDCSSALVAAAMKLTVVTSTACTVATQATDCAGVGSAATCNATTLTCQTRADTSTKGIGSCAALVLNLTAGTYYVMVEKSTSGTIAGYKLQVKIQTSRGNETEPNTTSATANGFPGSDVYIFGGHQVNSDLDVFAIPVPAGKSIRAEVIEGSTAETCESFGIDSRIRLLSPAGIELGNVDDNGRGFCSLLDGTGASPTHSYAHNLAAGTYFVQVEASNPISSSLNELFDYRLVVTVH
jgi:cysteine-rich repeat protein